MPNQKKLKKFVVVGFVLFVDLLASVIVILHQIFLAIFPSPCFLRKKISLAHRNGGKRTVSSENGFHSKSEKAEKKTGWVGLKKDRGPEIGKCKVFPANPKTPEEWLFLRTQKHPCYTGSNP